MGVLYGSQYRHCCHRGSIWMWARVAHERENLNIMLGPADLGCARMPSGWLCPARGSQSTQYRHHHARVSSSTNNMNIADHEVQRIHIFCSVLAWFLRCYFALCSKHRLLLMYKSTAIRTNVVLIFMLLHSVFVCQCFHLVLLWPFFSIIIAFVLHAAHKAIARLNKLQHFRSKQQMYTKIKKKQQQQRVWTNARSRAWEAAETSENHKRYGMCTWLRCFFRSRSSFLLCTCSWCYVYGHGQCLLTVPIMLYVFRFGTLCILITDCECCVCERHASASPNRTTTESSLRYIFISMPLLCCVGCLFVCSYAGWPMRPVTLHHFTSLHFHIQILLLFISNSISISLIHSVWFQFVLSFSYTIYSFLTCFLLHHRNTHLMIVNSYLFFLFIWFCYFRMSIIEVSVYLYTT